MWRMLNPAGWAAVAAAALAVLVVAGWLVLGRPAHERRSRVEAQAGRTIAEGAAAAAKDAQGVVIDGAAREAAADVQTGRNRDAIFNALGARVAAGAAGAAGLRGLCQRPAYRDLDRCRQLLGPRP